MIGRPNARGLAYTIIPCLVFIFLILPKINQPITDDEIYEIDNAECILSGNHVKIYVPPVYDHILALSIRLFGRESWAFRIPGILSSIATLIILIQLIRLKSPSGFESIAAGLLLAVHPAFVQASLLTHIDNSILGTMILFWIYVLFRYYKTPKNSLLVASVILLALTLIIKYSTPIMLFPGVLLFFFICRRDKTINILLSLVLALLVFAIIWFAWSKQLDAPFSGIFSSIMKRYHTNVTGLHTVAKGMAINLASVLLWFTPFLFLSIIGSTPMLIKSFQSKDGLVVMSTLCAGSIFLYLLIYPIGSGTPTYLMPALPFLIAVIAGNGTTTTTSFNKKHVVLLITTLAGIIYFTLLIKDPIYFYRYDFRLFLVNGTGKEAVLDTILKQFIIYLLPIIMFLVVLFFRKEIKQYAAPYLLSLCFSFCCSLSPVQCFSSYQTNYSYGEEGTDKVIQYLKDKIKPEDKVFAVKDIEYRLNKPDRYSAECWKTDKAFLEIVKRDDIRFFIASLPTLSTETWKMILHNNTIKEYLAAQFTSTHIGTYTIYEKQY